VGRLRASERLPALLHPVLVPRGRNRTIDTGIFSPFEPVEKSESLSGEVRQAPFKTRQGRYAEARSCTVPFTWSYRGPGWCTNGGECVQEAPVATLGWGWSSSRSSR